MQEFYTPGFEVEVLKQHCYFVFKLKKLNAQLIHLVQTCRLRSKQSNVLLVFVRERDNKVHKHFQFLFVPERIRDVHSHRVYPSQFMLDLVDFLFLGDVWVFEVHVSLVVVANQSVTDLPLSVVIEEQTLN